MNELTTTFRIESPPAWLEIGYDAENNWRTITINCEYWFNIDSNGVVVLMYKPACSKPAYPLKTGRSGNNIVWTPESAELVAGVGTMQAFFEVDGTTIGASKKIPCEVDGSLLGSASGGTPPWAVEVIEEIKTLTGHYPYVADGKLYVWDSVTEQWIEFTSTGGGAVDSVNGKTGIVVLDADDVGALPADTVIPPAVTEQTVSGWGFTKNTGTYSKPSGGIPKTDLASDVQTSLGKADTALQQHQSLAGYATESYVQQQIAAIPDELPSVSASDNGKVLGVVNGAWAAKTDEGGSAPFEIPVTESGGTFSTTATAADILAHADNCVAVVGGVVRLTPDCVGVSGTTALLVFGYIDVESPTAPDEVFAVLVQNSSVTVSHVSRDVKDLPTVTAADNGKFLRVVNGAWAAAQYAPTAPRVAMTAQDTAPTLEPNKLYVFPEMASLAPTLATPTDNTIVNEYHFIFASGATATTLTLPATINQPDGFTVEANHVYEVSILENCMTAQGWAVSA
jgi:hypothetical protein